MKKKIFCLTKKHSRKLCIIIFLIVFLMFILFFLPMIENESLNCDSKAELLADSMITQETEADIKLRYYSELTSENCALCGSGAGTAIPIYRGVHNIGIISLNTFTLSYVEINPYDDNKKPLKKPTSGSSTQMRSSGNNGYVSFISENQWRGYASGSITFNQDAYLDIEKTANFLCTDCFNQIMDSCWSDEPYGLGVIDFNSKEIRLFEENISAFMFNDYYISCKTRDRGEDNSNVEMELLIFYCPDRYSDSE